MSQFVWVGGSGCLLPLLIIFNLLFGKLVFSSTRMWLGIEAGLILLFIININIMARKISRGFTSNSQSHWPEGHGLASNSQSHKGRGKVVDIQGHEVREDKKLS